MDEGRFGALCRGDRLWSPALLILYTRPNFPTGFMMAVLPRRAPQGPGSLLNALWALELRGSPWLDEPDDSIWGRRYCPQVLLGAVAVMTPILLKRPQGSALFPWHQGWV